MRLEFIAKTDFDAAEFKNYLGMSDYISSEFNAEKRIFYFNIFGYDEADSLELAIKKDLRELRRASDEAINIKGHFEIEE